MIKCFQCNNIANHKHHVVPLSKGGTETVDLCEECHGLIHGINFVNHRQLTKDGLATAKARGVVLGKPENLTEEGRVKGSINGGEKMKMKAIDSYKHLEEKILELREGGNSFAKIAKIINDTGERTINDSIFTAATIQRIVNRII